MSHRVCPWWLGYFLLNPFRRLRQDPRKLLKPYVREGMTVLEPGPGMGFFTLELLRLVGKSGRVIAVDVQPEMLARLEHRATKAGLADRLSARLASADSMNITGLQISVDFILAFAVVHEFPDAVRFFTEVAAAAKTGAQLLLAEPRGHVKSAKFKEELRAAEQVGFRVVGNPAIRSSQTVLLQKL
jgi:ubiquinone/menaquinone biosynthesis C-methylase UbiE